MLVLTDIENGARRCDVDGAIPRVLEPVGYRGTRRYHVDSSEKQGRALAHPRDRRDAYDKVRDNLELTERGFPSADFLRARIVEGRPDYGMAAVGKDMWIPRARACSSRQWDRDDPRPLWVPVWGGPNVLRTGAVSRCARHARR